MEPNYILHNFILETFSALVLLVLIVSQWVVKEEPGTLNRLFLQVLYLHFGVLFVDALVWAADWLSFPTLHHFARVGNFLVYSLSIFSVAWLLLYVAESISLDRRARLVWRWIVLGLVAAFHVLLIVSQLTGLIYRVGRNNEFILGPWFFVPHLFAAMFFALLLALVLWNRKKLGDRATFTFLSYVLILVLALLLNVVFYYLMLLYAAMALALLVIYVNIQVQREKRQREKELELMENQIVLMLSQVQPHFLYNALYSISQLCDIDAAVAKESILDFGQYLRVNLDSLTCRERIPFQDELRHVRTYLSLEEKRFGERLRVVCDIGPQDFSLPALSLQPLVENAVRYGVTKCREGGTVTIRTRETPEAWQVEVADDGAGFDPESLSQDGRSHVGIANVRKRLELMCGGTLQVVSTIGKGTLATLQIPKEKM